MGKWGKLFLLNIIGLSMVITVLIASGISLSTITTTIQDIRYPYILSLIVISFLGFLLTAVRWRKLASLTSGDLKYTRGYFFCYSCVSSFLTAYVTGSVSNLVVKTTALRTTFKTPVANSSFSPIAEYALNLFCILTYLLPSFFFLFQLISIQTLILLNALLTIIVLIIVPNYLSFFLDLLIRVIKKLSIMLNKLPVVHLDLESLSTGMTDHIDKKWGRNIFLYSIVMYQLNVSSLLIVHLALELNFPLSYVYALYPISLIIASTAIIPAALGILELSWFGVISRCHKHY